MADVRGKEVQIPGLSRGVGPSYAVLPEGAKRGAVIIHELFGRQPEIDRVADRFAAAGYAAVVPDFFGDRSRLLCMRAAVAAIGRGEGPILDDVRGARAWLCEEAKLRVADVGVVGFCIGGGLALAVGPGWGAVSTNYGDVPPAEGMRGIGPVIGCYGGRDRLFRAQGERLRERLRPQGTEVEVHGFPEVGHSFLTDGHHPVASALTWPLMHIEYNPRVAEAAWAKILAFFDRHLGAGAPPVS